MLARFHVSLFVLPVMAALVGVRPAAAAPRPVDVRCAIAPNFDVSPYQYRETTFARIAVWTQGASIPSNAQVIFERIKLVSGESIVDPKDRYRFSVPANQDVLRLVPTGQYRYIVPTGMKLAAVERSDASDQGEPKESLLVDVANARIGFYTIYPVNSELVLSRSMSGAYRAPVRTDHADLGEICAMTDQVGALYNGHSRKNLVSIELKPVTDAARMKAVALKMKNTLDGSTQVEGAVGAFVARAWTVGRKYWFVMFQGRYAVQMPSNLRADETSGAVAPWTNGASFLVSEDQDLSFAVRQ